MCGNYGKTLSLQPWAMGSPPRVRELPGAFGRREKVSGITPACAGITRAGGERVVKGEDHPRVCGNYSCPSRDSP